MDQTQMRWQQIRSFEHLQRVERENSTLRSQLRRVYAETERLSKINENLVINMHQCMDMMKTLRENTVQCKEMINSEVFTTKNMVENAMLLVLKHSKSIHEMKGERDRFDKFKLLQDIDIMNKSFENLRRCKDNEIGNLKDNLSKHLSVIEDMKGMQMKDVITLKTDLEEERKMREALKVKNEVIRFTVIYIFFLTLMVTHFLELVE